MYMCIYIYIYVCRYICILYIYIYIYIYNMQTWHMKHGTPQAIFQLTLPFLRKLPPFTCKMGRVAFVQL